MKPAALVLVAVALVLVGGGRAKAGLIASFPMNDPNWSGPGTVTDATGNGHDGTPFGGANTVPDPEFGRVGSFSGNGQYVTAGGAGAISGARSVVAWVYVPANYVATFKGQPIVSGGPNSGFDNFGITGTGGENNGLPVNHLYIDHSFVYTRDSTSAVSLGQWNQVAYTYDGSNTINFYLNGQPAGSISGGLYNYNINTYVLGGNTDPSSTTTNGSLDGLLSQVMIYGNELTAAQVLALYQQPIIGPPSPPTPSGPGIGVPEPSSLVLLGVGVAIGAFAHAGRRKALTACCMAP
jgi:hypothetical protein